MKVVLSHKGDVACLQADVARLREALGDVVLTPKTSRTFEAELAETQINSVQFPWLARPVVHADINPPKTPYERLRGTAVRASKSGSD